MRKILCFFSTTVCLVTLQYLTFYFNFTDTGIKPKITYSKPCISNITLFENSLKKKNASMEIFYGINSPTRGVVFMNKLAVKYWGPAFILTEHKYGQYNATIQYICPGNEKQYTEIPVDEVKPIDHTILLGFYPYNIGKLSNFNIFKKDMGKYMPTWTRIWSRVFSQGSIKILAPTGINISDKNTLAGNLRLYYPKDFLPKPIKKGLPANEDRHKSGFITIPIQIAKAVREILHENGSLVFIHDDLMITKSLLKRIGGKQWITYADFRRFRRKLYEDGTLPGGRFDIPCPYCKEGFTNLFHDPRLKQYQKQTEDNRKYLDFVPVAAQSDFFYFSFHDPKATKAFLTLLDTFVDHKLFFEWALPTAVLLIQEKFGIEVYHPTFCATGGTENNIFHTPKLNSKTNTCEVLHPMKMGLLGEAGWERFFEFFTLNI